MSSSLNCYVALVFLALLLFYFSVPIIYAIMEAEPNQEETKNYCGSASARSAFQPPIAPLDRGTVA